MNMIDLFFKIFTAIVKDIEVYNLKALSNSMNSKNVNCNYRGA